VMVIVRSEVGGRVGRDLEHFFWISKFVLRRDLSKFSCHLLNWRILSVKCGLGGQRRIAS